MAFLVWKSKLICGAKRSSRNELRVWKSHILRQTFLAVTSLGDSVLMNSSYMLLALDISSFCDVSILKSSHAVQNSMFSSQNSDFRKMQKAAFPSAEKERTHEVRAVFYRCLESAWPLSLLSCNHTPAAGAWHLRLWLRSLSSDCAHWFTSSVVGLRQDNTEIRSFYF